MSEGGYFPWKWQTIAGNPPCDYSTLSSPLPNLPKGHVWVRNPESREWSIVDNTTIDHDAAAVNEKVSSLPSQRTTDMTFLPHNCDFLEHIVQSTDTFQGLCLKYGITPLQLRQVNKFSGSNLLMAPKTLIIPLTIKGAAANTKMGKGASKQDKINQFLYRFRNHKAAHDSLSRKEVIAYLDMNDDDLEMAIQDAKDDFGWELGEDASTALIL